MIRTLKSLLHWCFGAAAIVLAAGTILALVDTIRGRDEVSSPFAAYAIYAGFFVVSLLYATAWWTTTRKPRATRNGWAVAACIVNIAVSIFLLRYVRPFNLTFTIISLLIIAASIAGVALFARREALPDPALKHPAKRARIHGDRTHRSLDGIPTILMIAATWKATSLWMKWATVHHLPEISGLGLISVIALACLTTVVLHECGHALAGCALHMKLLGFRAGPFHLLKREGKWKLKLVTSRLFGGSVNIV